MFKLFSNILDFNHSVLSGAMDIIIVRNKDGSMTSSPFHVRYGSLQIVKTKEKFVSILVNGTETSLKMRLSTSGDAYFLKEPSSQKKSKKQNKEMEEQLLDSSFEDLKPRASSLNKKQSNMSKLFSQDADENLDEAGETDERADITSKIDIYNKTDIASKKRLTYHEESDLSAKKQLSEYYNKSMNWDIKCPSIEMGLCLNSILKESQNAEEIFNKSKISMEAFYSNYEGILSNPELVVKYKSRLYPYKTANLILTSLLLFRQEPPERLIQKSLEIPKAYFSFSTKIRHLPVVDLDEQKSLKQVEKDLIKTREILIPEEKRNKASSKRTFTPKSHQLLQLGLKPGRNKIEFVCSSRLTGRNSLACDAYLWESNDRIVISDVDGTITRSDVLGHLLPLFGKDWSHAGVTELFSSISNNNYKMLYLTARSICQAENTKKYLQRLSQSKCVKLENVYLPEGPLLTNPDGLLSSFKREVIDRTPQNFKIACLLEVKNLFPINPFYAGFGNRLTVSSLNIGRRELSGCWD